jgi:hypothetical protein
VKTQPFTMRGVSLRHSTLDRPPEHDRDHPPGLRAGAGAPRHPEQHQPPAPHGDDAERLAEHMVQVGSDYIADKMEQRFPGPELRQVEEGAPMVGTEAMTNKIIKARGMGLRFRVCGKAFFLSLAIYLSKIFEKNGEMRYINE